MDPMRYRDLTISYFGGLPPVRKVSGTATLADKQIEFTPTAGTIKSVHVTGGVIRLTDLGAPVGMANDRPRPCRVRFGTFIEVIDAKASALRS